MRVLAALSLAIAVASAACGGGDDDSSDGATPTATVDLQEAAEDAVQDALLTVEDFPPGWTQSLDDEEEIAAEDAFSSEFEEEFNRCSSDPDADFEGQLASAESAEFETGGLAGPSVSVETYAFDTDDHAQRALDVFAQVFSDCGGNVERIFTDLIERELERDPDTQGVEITSSLEERNTLKLGDASRNFHLELNVENALVAVEMNLDFTMLRQGRMAGVMVYFTARAGSERGRVATAFADKLYRANLTLPPEDDD